jgi:putative cell wall-binding protein
MAAAESSETVIVATGMAFPDALAASGLAGIHKAPLLLSGPGGLPSVSKNEILRQRATKAILIGGTAAVVPQVELDLLELGIPQTQIIRHAGHDRLDTMRHIYAENDGWGPMAIITNGFDFPEACCATSVACAAQAPIFMTDRFGNLDAQTEELILSSGFTSFLLIGGPTLISPRTEAAMKSRFGSDNVVRLTGMNHYDVSIEVARWAVESDLLSFTTIGIATGRSFPDCIVGGILQGLSGSVLLLSDPGYEHFLTSRSSGLITKPEQIRYFGGSKALTARFRRKLKKRLL